MTEHLVYRDPISQQWTTNDWECRGIELQQCTINDLCISFGHEVLLEIGVRDITGCRWAICGNPRNLSIEFSDSLKSWGKIGEVRDSWTDSAYFALDTTECHLEFESDEVFIVAPSFAPMRTRNGPGYPVDCDPSSGEWRVDSWNARGIRIEDCSIRRVILSPMYETILKIEIAGPDENDWVFEGLSVTNLLLTLQKFDQREHAGPSVQSNTTSERFVLSQGDFLVEFESSRLLTYVSRLEPME